MLTNDVLARLSQLNRATATPLLPGAVTTPIPTAQESLPIAPDLAESDTSELPSGEEVQNGWGKHWLRQQPINRVFPQWDSWLKSLTPQLSRLNDSQTSSRELSALRSAFPERTLYLDLETCGFAGSMVFLVGVIHCEAQTLTLSQLLARNYAEEKAVLQSLWTLATTHRVLVTFNGKSFDWPMVHDRSTIHHLGQQRRVSRTEAPSTPARELADGLKRHDLRPELIHCDLLHHARRRWRDRLPNCKLQTLEQAICGRRRRGDIPGRDIPLAYHDFVRTGDAWQMRNVLHHNALDLVTLLQISMCVAGYTTN
jgi:uncharacterized protein YprB with RNaseH-like and TPR domain